MLLAGLQWFGDEARDDGDAPNSGLSRRRVELVKSTLCCLSGLQLNYERAQSSKAAFGKGVRRAWTKRPKGLNANSLTSGVARAFKLRRKLENAALATARLDAISAQRLSRRRCRA